MNEKKMPFSFVMDLLMALDPAVKQFFGGYGIYHNEKILLILYDKPNAGNDRGVWVATDREHHASLRKEITSMRSIEVLGNGETNWQVVPVSDDHFERDVNLVCGLILKNDPRIGRIPKKKARKKK